MRWTSSLAYVHPPAATHLSSGGHAKNKTCSTKPPFLEDLIVRYDNGFVIEITENKLKMFTGNYRTVLPIVVVMMVYPLSTCQLNH